MTLPDSDERPPPMLFLEPREKGRERWSPFDFAGVPESVDWRSSKVTEPIRHQGTCQSCTSHAVAALHEAAMFRREGRAISISAPYIHFCIVGLECQQGLDLKKLVTNFLPGRTAPPHGPSNRLAPGECGAVGSGFVFPKLTEVLGDAEAKRALASNSPVVAGMEITADFEKLNQFEYVPSEGPVWHHTICIVGYDAKGWIIKNSYGEKWGHLGYFHINFGSAGILRRFHAYRLPGELAPARFVRRLKKIFVRRMQT